MSALQQDIEAFRNYMVSERGLSPNTVASYLFDLAHFARWVESSGLDYTAPTLGGITPFVAYLHAQRLKPSSIARAVACLKSFYRFMKLDELAKGDAVELLESPKLPQRLPKAQSAAAVVRLLNAPGPCDQHFVRDRAVLEMLYATGCRVSEVSGLKLADLSLDDGVCRVVGKGSKERLVMLGRHSVAALRVYLAGARRAVPPDAGFVFTSRTGRGAMSRIDIHTLVRNMSQWAGLPRGVSPHTLRHSFATHMLSGGANIREVQDLMGHSSIQTTAQYTAVDAARLKKLHREYHPRGNGHG